jgi:transcriptional regulatory protein LevR
VGTDPHLAERLRLLQASGQVDPEIVGFLDQHVPRLARELELKLADDTFGTAITHTALALQRARQGQAIEEWSSEHADELAGFPAIVAISEEFADRAEADLGLTVPGKEREFLALHLAALSLRAGG